MTRGCEELSCRRTRKPEDDGGKRERRKEMRKNEWSAHKPRD